MQFWIIDETTITQYVGIVNPSNIVTCNTLTPHAYHHYGTKFSYGKASALLRSFESEENN